MCFLQACSCYRHLLLTGMCFLQACVSYRHVFRTGMCFLQECASYRHLLLTGMCFLQACSCYRHLLLTRQPTGHLHLVCCLLDNRCAVCFCNHPVTHIILLNTNKYRAATTNRITEYWRSIRRSASHPPGAGGVVVAAGGKHACIYR